MQILAGWGGHGAVGRSVVSRKGRASPGSSHRAGMGFLYPLAQSPPGAEQSSEIFGGLNEPKGSQKVQKVTRSPGGLAETFLFSPWEPQKVFVQ